VALANPGRLCERSRFSVRLRAGVS
jgi:hypothetical protein